jgi:hypothetical protein
MFGEQMPRVNPLFDGRNSTGRGHRRSNLHRLDSEQDSGVRALSDHLISETIIPPLMSRSAFVSRRFQYRN